MMKLKDLQTWVIYIVVVAVGSTIPIFFSKNKKTKKEVIKIKKQFIEVWDIMKKFFRVVVSITFFMVSIICFLVYRNSGVSIHSTIYFIGFLLSIIITYLVMRFGF